MKSAEFAATLASALGAGARPIDPDKVRLRTVEFTADQLILKRVIDARLPDVCGDAETGIALLSYCLSELILRTARPGLLPEAVATAVQVLQFNCGVARPVMPPWQCPHGYTLPEHGLPPDCHRCAIDARINRGEISASQGNAEKAALMLDGHAINCQCDACLRATAPPLTDHEAGCSINGPIYGSTPHCDCAFGRQFK